MNPITTHLSDAITGADKPHQFRDLHMRQAKVVSVQTTSITVQIAGDTTTNIIGVRWAGYGTPKVNGGVVILDQGGFLLALPYSDQYATATSTSATPTLNADSGAPGLGAGSSSTGFYGTANGNTSGRYSFHWGTGGGLGTGNYFVSVPVTPNLTRSDSNASFACGNGHILNAATGAMLPFITMVDGTNTSVPVFRFIRMTTTVYVANTNVGITPGLDDCLVFNFSYW